VAHDDGVTSRADADDRDAGAAHLLERERLQTARLRSLAEEAELDPEFAEKYFNFIVAEVIRHHTQIAQGG